MRCTAAAGAPPPTMHFLNIFIHSPFVSFSVFPQTRGHRIELPVYYSAVVAIFYYYILCTHCVNGRSPHSPCPTKKDVYIIARFYSLFTTTARDDDTAVHICILYKLAQYSNCPHKFTFFVLLIQYVYNIIYTYYII